MFKYKWKIDFVLDGKEYKPVNGILSLPTKVKSMEKYLITETKEPVKEPVKDEKELLVKKANELGLGSPSILKRNTIETLRKKIAEVE